MNAKDYPSLQEAIDALPQEGGTVYIPAGTYVLTAPLYTPCDRPCHLLGELQTDYNMNGTILQWTTNTDLLRVRGDFSSVRRLVLKNTSGGQSAREDQGYGLAIARRDIVDAHPHPGTSTTDTEFVKGGSIPVRPMLIEDVMVLNAPGWALHIPGHGVLSDETTPEYNQIPDRTLAYFVDLKRVRLEGSLRYGLCFVGGGCTTTFFESCVFVHQGAGEIPNSSFYAYLSRCVKAVFDHCTFEGFSPPPGRPWVQLWGTESVSFNSCWFEEDATANHQPTHFLFFKNDCRGGNVSHCHFMRGQGAGGKLRLIEIYSSTTPPAGQTRNGARALLIEQPYCVTTEAPTENPHIKLGSTTLGDDSFHDNADISVIGSGLYLAQTNPAEVWPLIYGPIPSTAQFLGRYAKLRGTTDLGMATDRGFNPTNGHVVMNWDLPGNTPTGSPAPGSAMYYWGGGEPGWRLMNNVPTLTRAQRDARQAWVQGDLVYVSDEPGGRNLQIRVGNDWKWIALTLLP
ncbi:MAG: hypothetical protein HZC42_13840 [Candidatus Eisenbacteria bacterium]|nr:hypothetical protein [Candidatus Eisenbacteria bacterium]